MTIHEYLLAVAEYQAINTHQRYGQCLFNVLAKVRPDLAEIIRGNDDLDPFYAEPNSQKINAFLSWVESTI